MKIDSCLRCLVGITEIGWSRGVGSSGDTFVSLCVRSMCKKTFGSRSRLSFEAQRQLPSFQMTLLGIEVVQFIWQQWIFINGPHQNKSTNMHDIITTLFTGSWLLALAGAAVSECSDRHSGDIMKMSGYERQSAIALDRYRRRICLGSNHGVKQWQR